MARARPSRRWACGSASRPPSTSVGFGTQARILLTALKRYGMILADNGSPWYVTGPPSRAGTTTCSTPSGSLHGSDFEVVDTTGFVNG